MSDSPTLAQQTTGGERRSRRLISCPDRGLEVNIYNFDGDSSKSRLGSYFYDSLDLAFHNSHRNATIQVICLVALLKTSACKSEVLGDHTKRLCFGRHHLAFAISLRSSGANCSGRRLGQNKSSRTRLANRRHGPLFVEPEWENNSCS